MIVFLATPVTQTVARMDMPSHRQAMTCPRRSVLNLFILTICLTARAQST